jgi:hypothetical protein
MASAIRPIADQSAFVIRKNMAKIKLLTVAGPLLCHAAQANRVVQLLENRRSWGIERPLVMLVVHSDNEQVAAEQFQVGTAGDLGRFIIIRQKGHNETVSNAIDLFRQQIDPTADPFTAKRQSLYLTRRGGKGKPNFISPFLDGAGTTCGEWTRPMVRNPDGTVIKGFMKASVAVGFCPVECPYCYLNMPYTDGMDVALNWEDLADELQKKWQWYQYPINFGETSGLVEYDEWFVEPDGTGSMVQFVIDACAEAEVTPFFLTKVRYPRYLRFYGKVQVGISLMPEPVRTWLAPNGSPADELLDSLAWAWSVGAVDPVIRLTVIWQQKEVYPEFLKLIRDRLGTHGWRLTLDILRFTPVTASIIAKRYPDPSAIFANEISPDGKKTLDILARETKAGEEHVKKIRPPPDRQAEIFIWFRQQLNELGCKDIMLTPCKGDPNELAPLARLKVINAMPCACYGVSKTQKLSSSSME